VDTAALAAAGNGAARRSQEVLGVAGASGAALGRLVADLSGAQCAAEGEALRRAAEGVLGELAAALDRLGRLLSAAAGRFDQAEAWAARSMATGPASASSVGVPPSLAAATSGRPAS